MFVSALDDFIVEVGDVHAEADIVVEMVAEDATNDVESEVGTGMSHVRWGVNSGSAPEIDIEMRWCCRIGGNGFFFI